MNQFIIPVLSPIVSLIIAIFCFAFLSKSREAASAAKAIVDADAQAAKTQILAEETRARSLVQSELAQWRQTQAILDEAHTLSLIHSEVTKLLSASAAGDDTRIRLIFQGELAQWQIGFLVTLNGTYLRGGEAKLRFEGVEKTLQRIESTMSEALVLLHAPRK